ncbi:MAG: hypothetical protein C0172_03815 [Caldisphaera sp.]|uniref:hypothetical protein n=1 Tax=Caldisphaera sp. TaxID=2060322 RepID=UPI000CBE0D40|nr:MAG: hypothetical protein C0172_03815 [Caldisphaera sp.]
MFSERDMSVCPSLIAVSLPNKQSWAFEEISDTVFEKDSHASIVPSKYKGVYLIYLEQGLIDDVVKNFSLYSHAFISRVIPVKECGNDLDLVVRKSLLSLPKGFIKLIVHLREPLKGKVSEEDISNIVISQGYKLTKKSNYALVLENIEEHYISASGIIRKCGPSCITIYQI